MTPRFRRLATAAALTFAAGAAQAQTTTSTTVRTAPGGGQTLSTQTTSPQGSGSASASDVSAPTPPSGAGFVALTPSPGANVVTVLTQSGQFSTFLKAAAATNLTSVLNTPGLTVFAPTDTAFAALPPGVLDGLMQPDELPKLQKLLAYHLVNTKIPAIRGHGQTQVTTAAGTKVTLDGSGDQVKVNDATTLQPAVAAAGGATIYPIDKVLSPDYVPPPAATADAAPAAATTTDSTAATTKKTTRKKR